MRLTLALILTLLATTAAKAAPIVFRQGNTIAYGVTLKPHSNTVLACKKDQKPIGSDAATRQPYALTRHMWLDGGEIEGWRTDHLVATAVISQTVGLARLTFKSINQTINIEIICQVNQ